MQFGFNYNAEFRRKLWWKKPEYLRNKFCFGLCMAYLRSPRLVKESWFGQKEPWFEVNIPKLWWKSSKRSIYSVKDNPTIDSWPAQCVPWPLPKVSWNWLQLSCGPYRIGQTDGWLESCGCINDTVVWVDFGGSFKFRCQRPQFGRQSLSLGERNVSFDRRHLGFTFT